MPVETIQVIGHRRPVRGDVRPPVEAGIHFDQPLEVSSREWYVGQAVDADDLSRYALADLGLVPAIGQDHQAGMGMQVDEAGRDGLALRVDPAPGSLHPRAGRQQPQALAHHRNVARPTGCAATVDQRSVLDDDVGRFHHAGRRLPRTHAAWTMSGRPR